MTSKQSPHIYAVILNWNGWQDTLGCLESVLHSDYENLTVVVCDNGSSDDSEAHIRAWANGQETPEQPAAMGLRWMLARESATPLKMLELNRTQAESQAPAPGEHPVVFIQNGANLGFAGGNNVGLRYAMAQPDCDYVWMLNNDCLAAPAALGHMVKRMQRQPEAGVCGAKLIEYDRPGIVQALAGARFNYWLGTVSPIGAGEDAHRCRGAQEVEAELDYIIGACMLVSRAWLDQVGLLSEEYFLYFEEIDWASRGGDRFAQVYAPESEIYHKLGASIGGPAASAKMDCLALRNRLRYTRLHKPWALPTVWLGLLGALLRRARRGQWQRVPMVVSVMFGRWRWQ